MNMALLKVESQLMKKLKYRPKVITRPKFNSSNQYHALIPLDALYKDNLKRLKDPDFKIALAKIARDINLLLLMSDQQFWRELQQNQTVKISLQSCLVVLPRLCFDKYEQIDCQKKETIQQKDHIFKLYQVLMESTLLVYFRMSEASSKNERQILYDNWLLDIPKLLDLAGIYGEQNPEIVIKLISNAYSAHPNYDEDTLDFFGLIEDHQVLQVQEEKLVQIDFSDNSLNRRNYGNRQKYMLQQTSRQIFKIKDLLINLINFLNYFPKKYVYELASDYKIQERLLRGLAMFLKESSEDWKLQKYAKLFEVHLQDVRQTIAVYFVLVFRKLRDIFQGKAGKQGDQLISLAENTYETLCLCLSQRKAAAETPYYRRMVHHLFQETEDQIFFIPARRIKDATQRTKKAVEQCVKYENYYRKEKRIAGQVFQFDESYTRFLSSLQKYRQINAKKDGTAVKKLEQEQEALRLKREPLTADFHQTLYNLKYKIVKAEYQDQPEEKDEFKRVEPECNPSMNYQMNLSINVGYKKIRYVQKTQGLTNDSLLSIWDLSNLSQTNRFNETHPFSIIQSRQNSENSCYLDQIRSKEMEVSQPSKMSNFQLQADAPSVNLSVFAIQKSNLNLKDLSFSMVFNIKEPEDNQSFLTQYAREQEEASQLASILADIVAQVTPKQSPHESLAIEWQEEQKMEDVAEFQKFTWHQQGQLSFQITDD